MVNFRQPDRLTYSDGKQQAHPDAARLRLVLRNDSVRHPVQRLHRTSESLSSNHTQQSSYKTGKSRGRSPGNPANCAACGTRGDGETTNDVQQTLTALCTVRIDRPPAV